MPKGIYTRMQKDTGNTAVKEEVVEEAAKPLKKETGLRTVLHGYGRLEPFKVHYIDRIKFIGGVAHNVPKETAECWLNGTRPEGTTKPYAVDGKSSYSSVGVIVLDNDATEADYIKASGITPMPASKIAGLLKAYSAKELVEAMGAEEAVKLSEALKKALH